VASRPKKKANNQVVLTEWKGYSYNTGELYWDVKPMWKAFKGTEEDWASLVRKDSVNWEYFSKLIGFAGKIEASDSQVERSLEFYGVQLEKTKFTRHVQTLPNEDFICAMLYMASCKRKKQMAQSASMLTSWISRMADPGLFKRDDLDGWAKQCASECALSMCRALLRRRRATWRHRRL
jgi:hypothetical protein